MPWELFAESKEVAQALDRSTASCCTFDPPFLSANNAVDRFNFL
jgi:hypothetical protein